MKISPQEETYDKVDDLLTKDEQGGFNWKNNIELLCPGFQWFIEQILERSSYKSCYFVLRDLADYPRYTVLPILAVMKKKYLAPAKGDWRVLLAGIDVIGKMIHDENRCPTIPELYLEILNNNLKSKTKALKTQALYKILFTCYELKREMEISQEATYLKKEADKIAKIINISELKKNNIKDIVNSFSWRPSCEIAGWKWEYPSINPLFNSEIALKVLRTFWPDFTF